jgi:hypothetical protein
VPVATITIEHFSPTSTAIYTIDLGGVPSAASGGRVVFDRGVPTGASAALSLSTAGSGGPWTAVTDGDVVTTKQQTYHLKLQMDAPLNQNIAPHVSALGIEFRTPVDVTAEATVEPIAQEIDVPFLAASIGEGSVSVVRTGARDYRDQASDLATSHPVSALEVDVRLGSRHPLVPRSAWMLIDRGTVNNRAPSVGAEQFGLLSVLKKPQAEDSGADRDVQHRAHRHGLGHEQRCDVVSVTPAIPFSGVPGAYSQSRLFHARAVVVGGRASARARYARSTATLARASTNWASCRSSRTISPMAT